MLLRLTVRLSDVVLVVGCWDIRFDRTGLFRVPLRNCGPLRIEVQWSRIWTMTQVTGEQSTVQSHLYVAALPAVNVQQQGSKITFPQVAIELIRT